MQSLKRPALLALLTTLTACAHPAAVALTPALTPTPKATGATKDPLCSQLRIVQLSHADSTLTKQQVEGNNAVLDAVCGKTP